MGIRCNSGTIPVAVIPMQLIALYFQITQATFRYCGWEGI